MKGKGTTPVIRPVAAVESEAKRSRREADVQRASSCAFLGRMIPMKATQRSYSSLNVDLCASFSTDEMRPTGEMTTSSGEKFFVRRTQPSKSLYEVLGLPSALARDALLYAIRNSDENRLLLANDMAFLVEKGVWNDCDFLVLENQTRFIKEVLFERDIVVFQRDGSLKILARILGLNVSLWEENGTRVSESATLFHNGNIVRICLSNSGVLSRLLSEAEVGTFRMADEAVCDKFRKEQLCRLHYGEDAPAEDLWEYWFDQLKSHGILALLERYKRTFEEARLPGSFPCSSSEEGSEWFYEFQPFLNDPLTWTRYNIPEAKKFSIVSVEARRPALLFRDYLDKIGGDGSLPASLGEDCWPVELFCVRTKEINAELLWLPMELIKLQSFPKKALEEFLVKDLARVKDAFMRLIGQKAARGQLMTQIVSQAVTALREKRPIKLNELNMVFTGEPGVGKTTFAQIVGDILYFAGVLRVGHTVTCTGASIGQGTGTADSAVHYVRRHYQRARDGLLFIDELYGICPQPGEPATANQSAAISTITDCCLHGQCLTVGAGYKDQVEFCFFKRNEGLRRRFRDIPFVRFSDWELFQVFRLKVGDKLWDLIDEGGQRLVMWLFAGFTAPAQNGSFAERLVDALRAQQANVIAYAARYDILTPKFLTVRDVIVCWKQSTGGTPRDCEYFLDLHQFSLPWKAAFDLSPPHRFSRLRRQKKHKIVEQLLPAMKFFQIQADLIDDIELDCNDLWKFLSDMISASETLRENVSSGDNRRKQVHVVFESSFSLLPGRECQGIFSCSDMGKWDGKGEPRPCILFFIDKNEDEEDGSGSEIEAEEISTKTKYQPGSIVDKILELVEVQVRDSDKSMQLWRVAVNNKFCWVRKDLTEESKEGCPLLYKELLKRVMQRRGTPILQLNAPQDVKNALIKVGAIGRKSAAVKLFPVDELTFATYFQVV